MQRNRRLIHGKRNVIVGSYMANATKRNATAAQMRALANFYTRLEESTNG